MLEVYFSESQLYFEPAGRLITDGRVSPTVTLSYLLDQGYFQPIIRKGAFTLDDKAVLALSLGRCLIHLFGTSWTREWSSETVLFLRQESADSTFEEVLNIHHPYLACPLTGSEAVGSAEAVDIALGHSHIQLMSFAKLLLEIETGDRITTQASASPERLEKEICQVLDQLYLHSEFARECYLQAASGFMAFRGRLTKARQQSDEITLLSARKWLYDEIIQPLEINFQFAAKPSQSLIPRNLHLSQRLTDQVLSCGPPHDYLDQMMLRGNSFLDSQAGAGMDHNTKLATDFFSRFDNFRKQHIVQPPSTTWRTRSVIKVAILDTGIKKDNPSFLGLLNKTKRIRQEKKYPEGSRSPIKLMGNYVHTNDSTLVDTCGHGTHMAYLLMTLAPEADLYIYKISEGLKDITSRNVVHVSYYLSISNIIRKSDASFIGYR